MLVFEDDFEAAEDQPKKWHVDKYFPGMGKHVTVPREDPEDCEAAVPIMGLYAQDGLTHCRNGGFVFVHYNTKTTGDG